MTAGVPGLGLGGLFALLAALCVPLLRSSPRHGAARLFAMAILIIAAAILAWQSVSWLYSVVSTGDSGDATAHFVKSGPAAITQPVAGHLFGMPVIVISLVLMTVLLLTGEALFRFLGVRPTPMPAPVPAPPAHAP